MLLNYKKMKDYWKNRNVMVTGSKGFIGKWLCKELTKKGSEFVRKKGIKDEDDVVRRIHKGRV